MAGQSRSLRKPTNARQAQAPKQPDPVDDEQPQTQSMEEAEASRNPDDFSASMLTESEPEVVDYASLPNAPKDSVILGPNERLVVDGEMSSDGTHIKLSKAVHRAFLPMGSKRWAFMLEYPAGAEIPASMVVAADRKHPATSTSPEQVSQDTEADENDDTATDDDE